MDTLTNLEELDLNYNQIREIKGLEALTNLEEVALEDNPIPPEEMAEIDPSLRYIFDIFDKDLS